MHSLGCWAGKNCPITFDPTPAPFDLDRSKIVHACWGKRGLVWVDTICGKIGHLLLNHPAKVLTTWHTRLADLSTNRSCMDHPVTLTQPREYLISSSMSGFNMNLLYNQAWHWGVSRKYHRVFGVISDRGILDATANTKNTVNKDWA